MSDNGSYSWWGSLKHGGLLIAPTKLSEFYPEKIESLPGYLSDRLRRDVTILRDGDTRHLGSLLDTVLEQVLELHSTLWLKANSVGSEWAQKAITRENIKPRRIWLGPNGVVFPVFVADASMDARLRGTAVARLGIGRGRRSVSRVIEWLRKSDHKIALLTNGYQWRLIHAGSDYDAWCEWDINFWFEEGKTGEQVEALRILLGEPSLTPINGGKNPKLLEAIQVSRQGQAELSSVLGERVRQAVEILIQESSVGINELKKTQDISNTDLYIAANRMIMRCVVVLFAEARDLLPRDNVIYHSSYGIQGLREQLDRMAGGKPQERLRNRYSAWPRLLALFKLVHGGSYHESLPIPAYGGQLFAQGDLESTDPIRKVMTVFENLHDGPSDAAVYRILEFLTRSKVKLRQGRSSTWVDAPVDFSDLSSEYIGILYQGLLDLELRQAEVDEPMIFLNLGDQPVLPLSRLEGMSDSALESLVEKLKQNSKPKTSSEGEEDSDEEEYEEETENDEEDEEGDSLEEISEEEGYEEGDDLILQVRQRAQVWAVQAVKAGKLVSKPRDKSNQVIENYEASVNKIAERILGRIILPGEWFLVRWGGTRKGSGTFYTRPQLAVPLARRTLQPLVYEKVNEDPDESIPKLPEEILALKVCDPAMGSGSMLAAALRYLTDALFESLYFHGRIEAHGENTLCRLADGQVTNTILKETLPLPRDHPDLEARLKARLKRYVVERCIYGVDLDPLAVELAKLTLWIETMDRQLPFEFLDHKLKCGNSLVGCRFDRFQDYPVMAWEREGGDQNHVRFVNHSREHIITRGERKGQTERRGDKWTQAIKNVRNEVVKQQMKHWIISQRAIQFEFARDGHTPEDLHNQALSVIQEMQELGIYDTDRKSLIFRDRILKNQFMQELKFAFDSWCSIWFWPGDKTEQAPLPSNFHHLPEESREIIHQLATKIRFFHWELEFPDVFLDGQIGFDAIIQNPPWDILKPKSQEFFSNIDPLYRSYGKQDAINHQINYFKRSPDIEHDWLEYNAHFRALSNWVKHIANPFGDPQDYGESFSFTRSTNENKSLHSKWRNERRLRIGYLKIGHPFRYQGSADINSYKLFLELAMANIRDKGRLGLLSPSGIHSDFGSFELRKRWLPTLDVLVKFDNEKRIFDGLEHNSKFDLIIMDIDIRRSKSRVAFFAWKDASVLEDLEQYLISIDESLIQRVSPISYSIPELRSNEDKSAVIKLYSNGQLMTDHWRPISEFHMTNDSGLFKGKEMPIYQGGMIWLYDHRYNFYKENEKRFDRGKLEDVDLRYHYPLQPKYWTKYKTYENKFNKRKLDNRWHYEYYRIAYRVQSSRSNQRTFIATIIPPGCATANSLSTLIYPDYVDLVLLLAVLSSLAHDFNVRTKITSNINNFYFPQFAIPKIIKKSMLAKVLIQNSLKLLSTSILYKPLYDYLSKEYLHIEGWSLSSFALTAQERMRLNAINDALIFQLFGLTLDDVAHIVSTFPGVDSRKDPELRYPLLALVAFNELIQKGLDIFLAQNDGEGWMIPETLRLADYGLGHDDRAKEYQPVASRLGPRFLSWQLEGTPEQSWEECERHAENLHLLLSNFDAEPDKNKEADSSEAKQLNLL